MSEINYEAKVDELSEPGNEAELEKTLNDGFNQAAEGESADVPSDENNNAQQETPESVPAPPVDGKPAEGEKPNDGAGDRFKDILQDRNKAREAAANAQTENQALAEQVKSLTEMISKMQSGEGTPPEDGGVADDKPLTAKGVEDMVKNILSTTKEQEAKSEAAEKSDAEEMQKLFSDPNVGEAAKPLKDKIKKVMTAHPTVSALAAYAMAVGMESLQGGEGAPISNAQRTAIGTRTKTNLRREVKVEDMTPQQQEEYLRKLEKSGGLKGIV